MTRHHPPPLVVVMGVSGSGKSTVGAALAQRLACRSPTPTTSTPRPTSPRWPPASRSTTTTAARGSRPSARGSAEHAASGGVMSCSALKRAYRDQLAPRRPSVVFLHLHGDPRRHRRPRRRPPRALHARRPRRRRSSPPSSPSSPTSAAPSSTSTSRVDAIVSPVRSPSSTLATRKRPAHDLRPALPPARSSALAADDIPGHPGRPPGARRPARHRPDRRADHAVQAAPVPRA